MLLASLVAAARAGAARAPAARLAGAAPHSFAAAAVCIGARGAAGVARAGVGSDAGPSEIVGQVTSKQANFVTVRVDGAPAPAGAPPWPPPPLAAAPPRPELLCVSRALLKKLRQAVLVGDRVAVGSVDWADGRGVVQAVLPRDTELTDPAVANVDQVLVVLSLAAPAFDDRTATRFLVAAAAAGVPVAAVLNKADLVPAEEAAAIAARVAGWGYDVHTAAAAVGGRGASDDDDATPSATPPPSLDGVAAALTGRTTVLTGPSGVGKSSLINALLEREAAAADTSTLPVLATGAVSRVGRGRHTTRHVSLLPVAGGLLADTPGFNDPDAGAALARVGSTRVLDLFPDAAASRASRCEFSNCAHMEEPGCAVRPGWDRHGWYVELRREAVAAEALAASRAGSKAARQGTTRRKAGAGGAARSEALLDPRKNRRTSRRSVKQAVMDLAEEELGEYD